MNKSIFTLLIITMLFSNCKKEEDQFLVKKNSIGFLNHSTQVKDLKMVFPNDSIVNYKGDITYKIPMNLVEVYDKSGSSLLTLTPNKIADSTATIHNIRINDSRYKTEKGITTLSKFKDIQDSYRIGKIENLINSIVISVNEINAQFVIDKTELPENLRYDMTSVLEASQIPDNARINYFFINWN